MLTDAASKEDVERLEIKLDRVLLLLNGNGAPGVFTRLDRIEQWRSNIDKKIDRLVYPVILTFILSIAGIGWVLLIFGTPIEELLLRR